jgi:ABC-type nickel/cobalt efflux system permease component RcnA
MWLLFIPVVIVAVVLFSLVATLFAGVAWVIGGAWPWLLIGLGMWLFWREDGRHHRARRHRLAWESGSVRYGHKSERHAPGAERSEPAEKKKNKQEEKPLKQSELPIDIQVKVEQIRRKVDVLLGYADRFPPFSQDLYLVRQTASDYLPRTIDTYLSMPRPTAEKPLSTSGKTAHEELKAQLDLLDSKLDDIAQDLERQDTDRLLANRRFLEQRFGMRETQPFPDGRTGVA